jgi:hypothetical protein
MAKFVVVITKCVTAQIRAGTVPAIRRDFLPFPRWKTHAGAAVRACTGGTDLEEDHPPPEDPGSKNWRSLTEGFAKE